MKSTRAKLKIVPAPMGAAPFPDEIKSLNRIKGQIEGIGQMLTNSRNIEDIMMQMGAVRAALKSLELRLLENHLHASMNELDSQPKSREAIKALLDIWDKR